ncbi:MAG: hypothetical protein ABSF34_22230 [Verrucomicrobiota bacterium]
MKTKLCLLFTILSLFVTLHQAFAQEVRFFRISGPAATVIKGLSSDGTMIWTNAQPGTNYIIQTSFSLHGNTNWVDYVQIPVTNRVSTNLIFDVNPPTGMAFIPAGSFMMGDSLDDEADAIPINATVSAFCRTP